MNKKLYFNTILLKRLRFNHKTKTVKWSGLIHFRNWINAQLRRLYIFKKLLSYLIFFWYHFDVGTPIALHYKHQCYIFFSQTQTWCRLYLSTLNKIDTKIEWGFWFKWVLEKVHNCTLHFLFYAYTQCMFSIFSMNNLQNNVQEN